MKKIMILLALVFAFVLLFLKTPKTQDLSSVNAALVSKLSESPVAVEVFGLWESVTEV